LLSHRSTSRGHRDELNRWPERRESCYHALYSHSRVDRLDDKKVASCLRLSILILRGSEGKSTHFCAFLRAAPLRCALGILRFRGELDRFGGGRRRVSFNFEKSLPNIRFSQTSPVTNFSALSLSLSSPSFHSLSIDFSSLPPTSQVTSLSKMLVSLRQPLPLPSNPLRFSPPSTRPPTSTVSSPRPLALYYQFISVSSLLPSPTRLSHDRRASSISHPGIRTRRSLATFFFLAVSPATPFSNLSRTAY